MTRTLAALALLLVSCSSSGPAARQAPNEPEINLTQISNVAEAARNITGGISVEFRVSVTNQGRDPITVTRVGVQSMGAGAYTLPPASTPYNETVHAGETRNLDLWAPATIYDPTILGANGPVTIRAIVYYTTPSGPTQSIVVRQVHAYGGD